MSKSINVPKLRFKEFSGEWEEKLFCDIVTNKSKKYNPEKESISYKCIELEHLSTESGQLLGYVDSLNLGSIKNKFNKNDVLFGKLRPYLKKYLLAPFDGVCSSEIWVLNGINVTNYFLYYIVQSDYFIGLANQSSGSKMPRADWNIIENSIFFIPQKQEQEKIASFLTSVDTKIEQLTKKEELLQQYKKGVMQKIFNQEIRFKADDGSEFCEWEENKLADIGITYNGLTGKTSENFGSGKPYIQYKQIFDNSRITIDGFGYVSIEPNEKQNKVQFGDIFFTTSSETPNEVGFTSVLLDNVEEVYLNSFCFGYRAKSLDILNPYFAKFLFRSDNFRRKVIELAQGSTRYNISKLELMKTLIQLPCLEEQTKIANFLSAIDSKIEKVQKQLNSIKEFKKALLQQMFV